MTYRTRTFFFLHRIYPLSHKGKFNNLRFTMMSAPGTELKGIDDKSRQKIKYKTPSLSQHTPLLLLMTKRGPVDPVVIGYNGFDTYFSNDSLEDNSPWYSHQTELMRIAIESRNSTVAIQRLVDKDSTKASIVIGLNPQTNTVLTINKTKLQEEPLDITNFVPFFEIEAADPGNWGNFVGIEIYPAPAIKQQTIGLETGAFVYEAMVMIEDEKTGRRRVLPNLYGSNSTYFTLKRDSIYNGINYYFEDVMKDAYIEPSYELSRPAYFSSFKLEDEKMGTHYAAIPFYKTDVLSIIQASNGAGFKSGITIMLSGGDDGFKQKEKLMLAKTLDRARQYEEACLSWYENISEHSEITDMLRYPFSTIWDSGYTKEVKNVMINLLKYRKDIWFGCANTSIHRFYELNGKKHFEYQKELNIQELISNGAVNKAILQRITESDEFGTPTVRATLMMQDGVRTSARHKRKETLNLDLFKKVCLYCGSSDGTWRSEYAFDTEANNTLDGWGGVSAPYMSPHTRELAWDAGMIWTQYKNFNTMFYPTYQTVYPDDNSVLNNIFLMMACCYIQKVHNRAWLTVVGNSSLTNAEVVNKVDNYITTHIQSSFDGRFRIQSETYFTPVDILHGYSFTTETSIYSTVTKHRATFKINTHRMSTLNTNN